jgi:Spy/CpxP family protein refolding chaperone
MSAKTIFILVCVLNVASGLAAGIALDRAVLAQPPVIEGPRAGFERMIAAIDLTPEQATKVRALMERRRPLFFRAIEEVRPKLDALDAETDAELETLVTPAQFQRFLELRQRMKRDIDPPGRDSRPGSGK